jgi:hypothetical protein
MYTPILLLGCPGIIKDMNMVSRWKATPGGRFVGYVGYGKTQRLEGI